jgi:ABC-type molybdate transport system substrate-binding protein
MLSAIGSNFTASNNSAQIAALQKQLVQYEKQFQADESVGGNAQGSGAQLLASQITLVATEISQLSASLGKNIDVTA